MYLIAGNVYASLLAHLRGRGCKTFIADMKVKIAHRYADPFGIARNSADIFYYPDVMVTCDPQDKGKIL